MNSMVRFYLITLVATLLLLGTRADADPAEGTANTEIPEDATADAAQQETEAEGVFTTTIFPKYLDRLFPAGNNIEALIGFDNMNDKEQFDIIYIHGYLTHPSNFQYRMHNFTGSLQNATVPTGHEASLLYRFEADPQIVDSREYGFVIEVLYLNKDNASFTSTAFNGTVTVTDAETSMDAKTFFSYLSIIAIFGLAGFGIFKVISNRKGGKKGGKSKVTKADLAKGTDKGIDWDYVSPEHMKHLKKGAKSPPSPSSKSPKSPSAKSPKS